MIARDTIVAEARAWIGTPYKHQGRVRGVACDCLGLVLGVYDAVVGALPQAVPPYTPSWSEASGDDALFRAALRHLIHRERSEPMAGDVLLFRYRRDAPAKHVAIAVDRSRMVHAHDGASVVETTIGPWWSRRIAGVFSFPGVRIP